eukprot:TRINITY_DN6135_c0_g1_i2.p1 TRINITY_DN6135_c0_g1~~TRINITY_DN6135_c0_g1_i2.p1  ORF type:complete len:241 (-),score=43.19 TRINITY_DN6135_c0_g1_i2:121-843(-)
MASPEANDHVIVNTRALMQQNEEVLDSAVGDRSILEKLPALPEIKVADQRAESIGGVVCVTVIIVAQLVFAHLVVVVVGDLHLVATIIFLSLMYADAVMALFCLIRILTANPGTVDRCEEVCLPVPDQVLARLEVGEKLGKLGNIKEKNGTQTYCTRCCVWRPVGSHHCSTCQRCVVKFDHHCGVFGRCIAGEACGEGTPDPPGVTPGTGNIKYFQWILWCGGLATLLNIIFFVVSFATN